MDGRPAYGGHQCAGPLGDRSFGSGHANIVVLENDAPIGPVPTSPIPVIPAPASAALAILDAHGGLVERINGVPAGLELAVIDARGPVGVAPAVTAGGPARWMAPGSGRWPYAALVPWSH